MVRFMKRWFKKIKQIIIYSVCLCIIGAVLGLGLDSYVGSFGIAMSEGGIGVSWTVALALSFAIIGLVFTIGKKTH